MEYFEINGKCPFIEEFMKKEKWVNIQGFEGYYQVSNYGNVRSLDRTIYFSDGRIREFKGTILKQFNNVGYMYVNLQINKRCKSLKVHRLVLANFLGLPIGNLDVDHIDENTTNNRLDNLRYLTRHENLMRGTRIERVTNKLKGRKISDERKKIAIKGLEKCWKKQTKKISQFSSDNLLIKEWDSIKEASETLQINKSSICECCKGNYKTAGGYIWKYTQ